MLFLFVDLNIYSAPLSVSERHGSEVKQLSVAIGMTRKQSYYPFLAEKSTSCGGLQLPSRIKKTCRTFNKSVAQVQLNCHKDTLSHHRRTRRENCKNICIMQVCGHIAEIASNYRKR